MNIQLYYDPYLKKEAQIVQKTISKVFGLESDIHQKQRDDLLRFDGDLGIYTVSIPKKVTNTIYLTGNQIAAKGAKSAHDFLFGGANIKNRTVVISLARLRMKNTEYKHGIYEDPLDEVSFSVLEKRLEIVTVHEIGHWAIADKDHMDEFDYSPDSGLHCKDKKCVMYPGLLSKTSLYKNYFCPLCKKTLLGN